MTAARVDFYRPGRHSGSTLALRVRRLPGPQGTVLLVKSHTDFLWSLVRWAVPVTVAGVVAAVAIGTGRLNDEIRGHVQRALAARFPDLQVEVQGASLNEGQGIVVRGLSLSDPNLPEAWRQLLSIDEVHLHCDATLASLAMGPPEIRSVRVLRPVLQAIRFADGAWNLQRLTGQSATGAALPITVEGATVLYEDVGADFRETFRQGRLDLQPSVTDADGVTWSQIQLSLDGQRVERLHVTGAVALAARQFRVEAAIDGLDFGPQLVSLLPPDVVSAEWYRQAASGLNVRLSLNATAAGAVDALSAATFQVEGALSGGRFEHPRLPFPLTDVSAAFTADRQGLRVKALAARSGATLFRGAASTQGWSDVADFDCTLEAERLVVGRQWQPFLPHDWSAHWQKLLPQGEVDVRAELVRRGGTITPKVSLRCRNISITHYRFPYRLDRTVGTVMLDDRIVTVHLTGQAGGNPVQVTGALRLDDGGSVGHIEVRGSDMPIDDRLLAAMPAKGADVLHQLRAAGTFDFVFRQDRNQSLPKGHANSLDIHLADCSMRYVRFPYPLTKVRGTVRMREENWVLSDITGHNDTGVVRCSGRLISDASGRRSLTLDLAGSQVVLDQELRDALPGSVATFWDDLAPRGQANFAATVRHTVGEQGTQVMLEATPHAGTVSIEPSWFPYRLEELQGRLAWNDGLLHLTEWRGVHDRTTVAADGQCRFLPDGGWQVSLSNLSASHFRADHELLRALPKGLQRGLAAIEPRGLLSVDGSLEIYSTKRGADAGPPEERSRHCAAAWNCHVDMEQGGLDVGVALEHVHGGMQLQGRTDGEVWHASGELDLDSAIWQGVQLTQVRGPLLMDQQGVRFGAMATVDGGTPRRLTATVAGGAVEIDGMASASERGGFTVAASLTDASLERLACDCRGTPHRYRGQVYGSIEVSGTRAGSHSLRGQGQLRLRDADIYELPLVVAMLKVLRVKSPDRNAFGSSSVQFRIEGPHAYLDEIELAGDAISLVGNGEVGFDGDLQMTFRSIMGDAETQLPAMKRMLGGASGQFLLLHVDGTLADPELTTEAFPTLAAALQKLQSQRQETGRSRRLATRPRDSGEGMLRGL